VASPPKIEVTVTTPGAVSSKTPRASKLPEVRIRSLVPPSDSTVVVVVLEPPSSSEPQAASPIPPATTASAVARTRAPERADTGVARLTPRLQTPSWPRQAG
jgi:hypothetical protein